MIKIKRIDRFEYIGKKTWTEALDASKENYVFQTYEYMSTWWKYFGQTQKNRELLLLLAEDSSGITGIAPLMMTKSLFFNKSVIQFIGTDICDYMDFIIEPRSYEKTFLKITEYLSGLRFLEVDLKYIPEGSRMIQNSGDNHKGNKMVRKISHVDSCPYIPLKKDWQELHRGIKSKLRGEINRNKKKMQEKGELIFKSHSKEAPSNKNLEDYFDMHVKKWKSYSKTYSQFQYKHWRDFVFHLTSLMFNRGWLDFSYLEFDKNMVACHFGFRYKDRLYYYMPTFDPTFVDYSPAKILIMKMIENSFLCGLKEFDFLRGKEPYKMAWTKISRPIYNIFYYSKIIPLRYSGFMYRGLLNNYTRNVKPMLKKFRPLMHAWYKSKGDIP